MHTVLAIAAILEILLYKKPSQKSSESSHEAWVIIIMRDGSVMTAQYTASAWLGKFLHVLYCQCHDVY